MYNRSSAKGPVYTYIHEFLKITAKGRDELRFLSDLDLNDLANKTIDKVFEKVEIYSEFSEPSMQIS